MVDTVFTKSKTKTPLKTAFSNVKKPTGSTGHMDTSNVPQDIKDKVAKWTRQAHHNRTMKKPKTFNEFLEDMGAMDGGNATHGTATTNMVGSTSKPLVIKKLILGNKIARRKKPVA